MELTKKEQAQQCQAIIIHTMELMLNGVLLGDTLLNAVHAFKQCIEVKVVKEGGYTKTLLKTCPVCNKDFNANTSQKYCSIACRKKNEKQKKRDDYVLGKYRYEERACKGCGKEYRPKIKDQQFCSKACSNKSYKDKARQRDRDYMNSDEYRQADQEAANIIGSILSREAA